MLTLICCVVAYVLVALFVWLVASATVNPYGHLTNWQAQEQAIPLALLWPLALVYVVLVYVWYVLLRKD